MDIKNGILEADKEGKTPAFCYDRVSTIDQAKHGHSLGYQQDTAQYYANRKNLHIVHTFTAAESARKGGERKVFHEMLNLAAQYEIKNLIFSQTDRMSRNYKDLVKITDLIENEGYHIHFYHNNMVIHKNSTPYEKFMLGIEQAVAKQRSDEISYQVKKIIDYRLSQGVIHCGRPPFGYLYDKKEHVFIKDPETESILMTMFDIFDNEEISIQGVVDFMNSHGYTTSRGGPWNTTSIHRILSNSFYAGYIVKNGETHHGAHAPYISQDRFSRRMARAGIKKSWGKGRDFLLKGLLRNGDTGRILAGQVQGGAHESGEYIYYSNPRPVYFSIREDRVMNLINDAVKNISFNEQFQETILDIFSGVMDIKEAGQEKELAFIARRIGKLESENRWLLDQLKKGFDAVTIKAEMKKNRELIENLETQRKKLRISKEEFVFKVSDCMEACRKFGLNYLNSPDDKIGTENKIKLLKDIAETVRVFKDRAEIQFRAPFKFIFDPEIMQFKHDLGAADAGVRTIPVRGALRDNVLTAVEKMAEKWILWLAA